MDIHAFICTRDNNLSVTTQELLSYLDKCDIEVHLLVNKSSIFNAYADELALIEGNPLIIMCHDDIEILCEPSKFKKTLVEWASGAETGLVGVAGTQKLAETGVWWDRDVWMQKLHRGCVFHEQDGMFHPTWYGGPGNVVVLDGLFLAGYADKLRNIGLEKPKYFEGDWDFYDIYYSLRSYESCGYINKVMPIYVKHDSVGELAGRESWHKNRKKLIQMYRLPIQCR